MRKSSTDPELAAAFETHLKETQKQVERLERIGELMDVGMSGKKCKAMEGLIAEGGEVSAQTGDPVIVDLAISGAACRVEHYEIAGYSGAVALARKLGKTEVASLLTESLQEEQHADEVMRKLADRLTPQHA